MKKIATLTITLLVIAAFSLTACAASNSLSGTTWKLVSYGPPANPINAVVGAETSLSFDQDGKLSGTVGCNSLSGDYKVSGNTVTFGPIVTTLMACDEPLMQQETAVTQVLADTAKFSLENGKLTVTSQNGETAVTFEQVGK
jgi:heat shock protein HslJ